MPELHWLGDQDATESRSRQLGRRQLREVEMELADIQIYLIRLSQVLGWTWLWPATANFSRMPRNTQSTRREEARGNTLNLVNRKTSRIEHASRRADLSSLDYAQVAA